MSGSEARALIELVTARGIAQGELAGLLGLEKSTVSRAGRGPGAEGLDPARRDEGNQRYVRLYLTPEGGQVATRVWAAWHSRQARILADLSAEERAGLSAGLRGLVRGLAAEGLLGDAAAAAAGPAAGRGPAARATAPAKAPARGPGWRLTAAGRWRAAGFLPGGGPVHGGAVRPVGETEAGRGQVAGDHRVPLPHQHPADVQAVHVPLGRGQLRRGDLVAAELGGERGREVRQHRAAGPAGTSGAIGIACWAWTSTV